MVVITGLASIVPLSSAGHQAGVMGGPFMFAPFGFLLLLLVVGGIGYAVFRATQRGGDGSAAQSDRALETLRSRYATGEIDDEEFQTRKRRLQE